LQHVGGDVEGSSHASDAIASRIIGQAGGLATLAGARRNPGQQVRRSPDRALLAPQHQVYDLLFEVAAHYTGQLQCFGEYADLADAGAFAYWLAPLRATRR
jgi:hypothetical protein